MICGARAGVELELEGPSHSDTPLAAARLRDVPPMCRCVPGKLDALHLFVLGSFQTQIGPNHDSFHDASIVFTSQGEP